MERIQLAEGVFLNFQPCRKFKSNYLTMQYITPLAQETAAVRALFPRILRRGCAEYPDMAALTERMQMLYGVSLGGYSAYKRGEMQILNQNIWMLDNSVIPDDTDVFGGGLSLFRDVWYYPLVENEAFRGSYTNTEKNTLCDAIRSKINNKNSYAPMRCSQEMFRDERYGVAETGEISDVEKQTAEAAYAAYLDTIRRMPCEMYYIGRGDADRIAYRMQEVFSLLHRTDIVKTETAVIRSVSSVREVEEEQPTAQSKLSMGFRTGTCEAEGTRAVMLMFNEIFGSGPTSKLFMNVREKRSLCYYCSSAIEQIKGVMMVSSGIEAEKREEAQNEILVQLEEIRNGNITDAEMNAARKSLRCALTQIEDEPESIAMWHFGRRLSGQETSLQQELQKIESVTKEEIADAAKRISLDTVYFMRGTKTDSGEEEFDEQNSDYEE